MQNNSKVDFGILVWKTDWFRVVFATKVGISISKLAIKKEFDNSKCLLAYADIDFDLSCSQFWWIQCILYSSKILPNSINPGVIQQNKLQLTQSPGQIEYV